MDSSIAVNKVAQEIYDRIDNDLYDAEGDRWWQSDSPLYLIQCSVNPARVGYLKKILFHELKVKPQGKAALEVGCGGGILSEEIARMGFDITGIDPSDHSLQIAASHAKASGLRIKYEQGTGEAGDGGGEVAKLREQDAEDECEREDENAQQVVEGLLLLLVGAAVFDTDAGRNMEALDGGLHLLHGGAQVRAFEATGDSDETLKVLSEYLVLCGKLRDLS